MSKKKFDWTLAFQTNPYMDKTHTEFSQQLVYLYEILERLINEKITDADISQITDIVNAARHERMKIRLREEDKRNRSIHRANVLSKLTPEEQIALGLRKGRI